MPKIFGQLATAGGTCDVYGRALPLNASTTWEFTTGLLAASKTMTRKPLPICIPLESPTMTFSTMQCAGSGRAASAGVTRSARTRLLHRVRENIDASWPK
jgi:hypothetical protein